MRFKAKGRWIEGAIRSMQQSNRDASVCLRRYGATACTDVTGFGLVGHLVEMTKASAVDAQIRLAAIPVLDGARETIAAGLLSSLQTQNIRLRLAIANVEAVGADPVYPVLFDPQTAGGLLASVPASKADACAADLRRLGYEAATIIGVVKKRSDRDASIWINS